MCLTRSSIPCHFPSLLSPPSPPLPPFCALPTLQPVPLSSADWGLNQVFCHTEHAQLQVVSSSPAPRQTSVVEGLTGQGRGRWREGEEGQTGRRGRGGACRWGGEAEEGQVERRGRGVADRQGRGRWEGEGREWLTGHGRGR